VTVQFSPDSLRSAGAAVLHIVVSHEDALDDGSGEDIVNEEGAEILAAELLRDLRADAPVFLYNTALRVADEWAASWVCRRESAADLMSRFEQGVPSYTRQLAKACEWYRCAARDVPQVAVRWMMPAVLSLWDGQPPQMPQDTALANMLARVDEQTPAIVAPLRAKADLLARLFETVRPLPGVAHASEEERIDAVLHEYGLPRPEAEPRARARP